MAVREDAIPYDQFEDVRKVARSHAIDRYLAALLAPRAVRGDLIALAAFAGEIERVPLIVSEPALGEIRLKWWLDWLDGLGEETSTGNPVADVFGHVVIRRGLSRALIGGIIDARGQELYGAPFDGQADCEAFISNTEGGVVQLAAKLATMSTGTAANVQEGQSGSADGAAEALMAYGMAYGGVRQILRVPLLAQRGRWGLPTSGEVFDPSRLGEPGGRAHADEIRSAAIGSVRAALAGARQCAGSLTRAEKVACLPAALVAPYLKALDEQGDWLAATADISPLGRVWQMWRSHLSGRI
ncbi:MAG: squalene/phytoene synthase family protein [Alphaproteobacteria bacterium]|nr:squalene/phytoene synthase family protein [Alphaproteobacteria bacterium]